MPPAYESIPEGTLGAGQSAAYDNFATSGNFLPLVVEGGLLQRNSIEAGARSQILFPTGSPA
jgi:hypothetical protein